MTVFASDPRVEHASFVPHVGECSFDGCFIGLPEMPSVLIPPVKNVGSFDNILLILLTSEETLKTDQFFHLLIIVCVWSVSHPIAKILKLFCL